MMSKRMIRKSVAIITNLDILNYGSLLQSFALYEKIKSMDMEPFILIKRQNKKNSIFSTMASKLGYYFLPSKNHYNFIDKISIRLSRKKYCEKNKKNEIFAKKMNIRYCQNLCEARGIIEECDLMIAGSDQIWNPKANLLSEFTLLDFTDDIEVHKVSYASSVAVKKLTEDNCRLFEHAFKSFEKISVRENSTIKLLENYTDKKIRSDIDPTLLYSKKYWEKYKLNDTESDYIFVYMLRPEKKTLRAALLLSEKTGLRIKLCSNRIIHDKKIDNITSAGVEEFITIMYNARYILTNSFHGTVFSVIFNKQFLSTVVEGSGSRVNDLLVMLNLKDRILIDEKTIETIDKTINWNDVNNRLDIERKKSIDYIESFKSYVGHYGTVLDDVSKCTGCSACLNICPKNAIRMASNSTGFKYPLIDKTKCVDCNLCRKKCPILNDVKENECINAYGGASKDDNILNFSSSGGLFTEFAKKIIDESGIVYGVTQTKNKYNEIYHIRVDSMQDIRKINGSKYAQSDVKGSFKKVKEDLNDGKKVMFSGTACQIAGLYNYLKKDYDNLITVEIFCHGVPSVRMFNEFISFKEKKEKIDIDNYIFRTKKKGWNTKFSQVFYGNGKNYFRLAHLDSFYYLFLNSYILRESCYNCKYSGIKRISDISIGDYWGVRDNNDKIIHQKSISEKKGISAILINTQKGQNLFNGIKNNINYFDTSVFDISRCQGCLKNGEKNSKVIDNLFNNYYLNGYSSLEKFYKNKTKKKKFLFIIKNAMPNVYFNFNHSLRLMYRKIKKLKGHNNLL